MTAPVKSLAFTVYGAVSDEIIEKKGVITIGDMTKVINAINSAQKKEMPQSEAIKTLATNLIEVASAKNQKLGQLATGIGNMSVAKNLSFRMLVNLKIAGKKMRGVSVGRWETLKSYLSAAMIKLGFGIKSSVHIEAAKTPEEVKEIIKKAGEEATEPAKKKAAKELAKTKTPQEVKAIAEKQVKEAKKKPESPKKVKDLEIEPENQAILETPLQLEVEKLVNAHNYDRLKNLSNKYELETKFEEQIKGKDKEQMKAYYLDLIAEACHDRKSHPAMRWIIDKGCAFLHKEMFTRNNMFEMEERRFIIYYLARKSKAEPWSEVRKYAPDVPMHGPNLTLVGTALHQIFGGPVTVVGEHIPKMWIHNACIRDFLPS